MSDFKLTFGNTSNNQSLTNTDLKAGLKKSSFSNKVDQSIFTKIFDKNKDGNIDEEELNKGLEDLQKASQTDGNNTNLSEDEALALLAQYNIEDAGAQDLFAFFNKAKTLSKKEPEKKQVMYNNNDNKKLASQNQENPYFMKGIEGFANMNKATGEEKVAWYNYAQTNMAKSTGFKPYKSQELIELNGNNSISAGLSTEFSNNHSFNKASAIGRVKIGSNGMINGGVAYTQENGGNDSGLLNAYIRGQALIGNVQLSGTASHINYNSTDTKMDNTTLNITGSMPIAPVEDSKVWHGGTVKILGEYTNSNSTITAENGAEQGHSTLIKGSIGADYKIGTGLDLLGDINLHTNVSAFNLSNTGGTQIAGGASADGIRANFGKIPSYSGWVVSGLDFDNIKLYKNDNMSLKGNFSYSSNFYEWGALFDRKDAKFKDYIADNAEYMLNAGATLHLNSNNSDISFQGRRMVTPEGTENDLQVSYGQNLNWGDNTSARITAALGHNSNTGVYGNVGVGINIGNPNSARRKPVEP